MSMSHRIHYRIQYRIHSGEMFYRWARQVPVELFDKGVTIKSTLLEEFSLIMYLKSKDQLITLLLNPFIDV
jgi:hypothetical protein